jgi:UDP:flavonoid glycosyltransferase YjiC (YdhE family)
MATILLSTLPLSSATNASLKLAASLRKRGHTVAFIGIKDGEAMLAPYGYEFITVFEEWFPAGFVKQWLRSKIGKMSLAERLGFLLDERKKLLRHQHFIDFLMAGGDREYVQAVQRFKPDLILVDATLHSHWALLAYRSGVKCVYYNPGLPLSEDPAIPPLHTDLPPGTDPASRAQVRRAWKQFFARRWRGNKLMALAGIADWVAHFRTLAHRFDYPLERFNTHTELMPLLDWPMLVMCPAAFDFAEARNRPNTHYGEAFIELDRKEPEFPWHRLDNDKTLVYCSLGSVASSGHFYQRVIDAVASEKNWQLVLNLGPELSPDGFLNVPANAILVNGAPQLSLLRLAAVMITHGGIGTTKECVFFGVPQIVFPIYFDQFGSAARVKYHGVGAAGNFIAATASDIHALLDNTLKDAAIKSRVLALSQTFQNLEADEAGAAFVESQLP